MGERQKTLGVLTGGGDVPGLNPALKTLVTRASEKGYRVIGIRRGWGGLLAYDRDDPESWERTVIALDRQAVRTVDRTGGTFLHTSRTNPAKVATADVPAFLRGADFDPAATEHHDCTGHVLKNLEHLPISTIMQGEKRVDVAELYDTMEYRPKVRHVLGKPMFLY